MSVEPQNSGKPTLEDLLRLKRSERPPEAFWSQFDAHLREKQLAALIPVQSFWSRFQFGLGRFAKLAVPVTGAAAVAIGFLAYDRLGEQDAIDGRTSREVEVASPTPKGTPTFVASGISAPSADIGAGVSDTVRTVVITASTNLADVEDNATIFAEPHPFMGVDEITKTLPWLANVDLRKDQESLGLKIAGVSNVNHVPPGMQFNVSDASTGDSPAWAPTESHIRAAVASDIGLSAPQSGIRPKTWPRQSLVTHMPIRSIESRIESEYRGEISRVGVTASTLSFKF